MRKIVATVVVLGVALAAYAAVPKAPPAPIESFEARAARICAVEAGKSKQDQDDCLFKKKLGAAFEQTNRDYDKRLRDASR